MNHLLRSLAPLSDQAWSEIEDEATRSLRHFLSARKLVDFSGPSGWETSAVNTGRVESIDTSVDGVEGRRRVVHPLLELRTPFALDRSEMEALGRGAPDIGLDPVVDAARAAALAEDLAVFHGSDAGAIQGVGEETPHAPIIIDPENYDRYPHLVAQAVGVLQAAGVAGPYAIALGPRCWRGVMEHAEHGGYPLIEHIRLILGGPVVWAPAVNGAVVLSQRGGDFELICGQDLSIGYLSHDAETVRLYLEESFTFRLNSPEAAVRLRYED